jgi:hypothetical protein
MLRRLLSSSRPAMRGRSDAVSSKVWSHILTTTSRRSRISLPSLRSFEHVADFESPEQAQPAHQRFGP